MHGLGCTRDFPLLQLPESSLIISLNLNFYHKMVSFIMMKDYASPQCFLSPIYLIFPSVLTDKCLSHACFYASESPSPDELDCRRKPGTVPDLAGSQIDHLIQVRFHCSMIG